jgi:hypothetical protein
MSQRDEDPEVYIHGSAAGEGSPLAGMARTVLGMGGYFTFQRGRELKYLCERFAVKPGFAMTVLECFQVLRFVGKRHDLMHSDVKEVTTTEGIQACISEAMGVSSEDWPADTGAPPELIRRTLIRYEEI